MSDETVGEVHFDVQKPGHAVGNIRDEIKRIVKKSDKQPPTNDYESGFFDGQLSALRWAMAECAGE